MDEEEDLLGQELYKASEDSDELNEDQEDELLGESDPEDESRAQAYNEDRKDDDYADAEFVDCGRDEDVLDLAVEDFGELDKLDAQINARQNDDEESESDDDTKTNNDKHRGRFLSERGSGPISTVVTTQRTIPDSLDNVLTEPKHVHQRRTVEQWNSNKRNERQLRGMRGQHRPNLGARHGERNFSAANNNSLMHHQQRNISPMRAQYVDQQLAETRTIHVNPNFKRNVSSRNEVSAWDVNCGSKNTSDIGGPRVFNSVNPSTSGFNNRNAWPHSGSGYVREAPGALDNHFNANIQSQINNNRQSSQNQLLPSLSGGHRNVQVPMFSPMNQDNDRNIQIANRNFSNNRNFNEPNVNNFFPQSNFNQDGNMWKHVYQPMPAPNFEQHRGGNRNFQNNSLPLFDSSNSMIDQAPPPLLPHPPPSLLASVQQAQHPPHPLEIPFQHQSPHVLHHNQNQFHLQNPPFKQQQQQPVQPLQMLMQNNAEPLQQFSKNVPNQPFRNVQHLPQQLMGNQPLLRPTNMKCDPLQSLMSRNHIHPLQFKNDDIAQYQGIPLRNLDFKAPRTNCQPSALKVIQPISTEQLTALSQLERSKRFPKVQQQINPPQRNPAINATKRSFPQTQSCPSKQPKLMGISAYNTNRNQNPSNMKEVVLVDKLPAAEPQKNQTSPLQPPRSQSQSTEVAVSTTEQSPIKSVLPKEDEEDEQTKQLRVAIELQKKQREEVLRKKEERRREVAQLRRQGIAAEGVDLKELIKPVISTPSNVTATLSEATKSVSIHEPVSFSIPEKRESQLMVTQSINPNARNVNEEQKKTLQCQMGQKQSNLLVKTGLASNVVGTESKIEQSLLRNKQSPPPPPPPLALALGKSNSQQSGHKIATNNKSSNTNVNSKNVSLKHHSLPRMVPSESRNLNAVLVENLATSTSEVQIRKMCEGVGEVQEIQFNNQERKAHIQFRNVNDAENFTKKYQRRLVDLSLINVSFLG